MNNYSRVARVWFLRFLPALHARPSSPWHRHDSDRNLGHRTELGFEKAKAEQVEIGVEPLFAEAALLLG